MEPFQLIKQGAEAKLYTGTYLGQPVIAKERFVKKYRHPTLDTNLTKERIKAECRAIVRCKTYGIRTPNIYFVDLNRRIIFMEYFTHNISLKDYIPTVSEDILKKLSYKIGSILGKMHQNNIIHGDLTSSNMLLINKTKENCFSDFNDLHIVLIDFGLAHIDSSTEDKGVDLYVLERALLSTHEVAEVMFPVILNGYKDQYKSGFKEVLAKYEEVRLRGRKRTMVG